MSNHELSQEQLDAIADTINAAINIPFLNEAQEKMLLKLLLSILLDKLSKLL